MGQFHGSQLDVDIINSLINRMIPGTPGVLM